MTKTVLALRNLVYHWRGNLAVFLGVVVGTAVLTGALLVGDSLQSSLRRLTLERLGWVDQALVGPHFFRESLASSLPAERAEAAILLRATASRRRAFEGSVGRINLLGVAHAFDDSKRGVDDGVVLSAVLAEALDVRPGDTVTFRVQKADDVPRESLLGRRDEANAFKRLTFTVTAVLPEGDPAARFNLQPTPEPPRNAFVPLAALQDALDQPGRANALLIGGARSGLAEAFRAALDIEDWGLRLTGPDDRAKALFDRYDTDQDGILEASEWWKGRYKVSKDQWRQETRISTTFAAGILGKKTGDPLPRTPFPREQVEGYFRKRYPYLSLESRQLILEPDVAKAALEAADDAGLRAAPTLVYLCKLEAKGKPTVAGIVAALDPAQEPPLGPFLPKGKNALADDEIALLDWTVAPTLLPLDSGAKVTLVYKPPEHRPGKLPDETREFRFAGTVPLAGAADDPNLTPPFPGITDAELPSQWKLPFEDKNDPSWNTSTVRTEYGNPIFWGEQRTTPKAYITLAAGKKMWSSRFGDLTSVRLAPRDGSDLSAAAQRFRAALRKHLDPGAGGLILLPVKADALKASSGGTDFAQLFLYFSFFLIAAALLLVGLLFRLNADRRASEIGLLLASGYRHRTVRRLFELEASFLTSLGALFGVGAALGYTSLLVGWLGRVWPGGTLRSFLRPSFTWTSLAIGFEGSAVASLIAIVLAVRGLLRTSPRALLAGQTTEGDEAGATGRPRWAWRVAVIGAVGAAALLAAGPFVKDHEAKAGTFFGAGALLLTAALAGLSAWMRGSRHRTVSGGPFAIERLGIRNAARNPVRSLLTAGLLASAAFLLVAVEAFRRSANSDIGGEHSASGGFSLIAESDLPVLQDFKSDAGRAELRRKLVEYHRQLLGGESSRGAEADRAADDDLAVLQQTTIVPLRVRAGDDASCLNLYQPRTPNIYAVPDELVRRGGFAFADAPPGNAWEVLERKGEPFAAIGEQNTVVWMLKSGRGKTLEVPDEQGTKRKLRIEALLQDSVFQSSLLISEESFLTLYPNHAGYNFFLIAPPAGKEQQVTQALQAALADRGLEVTPTVKRLQTYLDVENTYLSTFQALGGLGLLLGSLGLAVVLLRGVWERRAELALLRALGYRRGTLGRLVLAENGFLLLVGLAAGTASALLAVAPHLLGGAGSIPWAGLASLLSLVLVVGLLAGALAVAATLRAPLIPALRRE